MKVGDIGVLQNLDIFEFSNLDASHLNGMIAEIIDYSEDEKYPYIVYCPIRQNGDPIFLIAKHEIRPLSDPDATRQTEQEAEVS